VSDIEFEGEQRPASTQKNRLILDRIMLDPAVLGLWSVPLSDMRPSKASFRDLLFVYE
jgi:hypothetical protein